MFSEIMNYSLLREQLASLDRTPENVKNFINQTFKNVPQANRAEFISEILNHTESDKFIYFAYVTLQNSESLTNEMKHFLLCMQYAALNYRITYKLQYNEESSVLRKVQQALRNSHIVDENNTTSNQHLIHYCNLADQCHDDNEDVYLMLSEWVVNLMQNELDLKNEDYACVNGLVLMLYLTLGLQSRPEVPDSDDDGYLADSESCSSKFNCGKPRRRSTSRIAAVTPLSLHRELSNTSLASCLSADPARTI